MQEQCLSRQERHTREVEARQKYNEYWSSLSEHNNYNNGKTKKTNYSSIVCQYCDESGHSAKNCYKIRASSRATPRVYCLDSGEEADEIVQETSGLPSTNCYFV